MSYSIKSVIHPGLFGRTAEIPSHERALVWRHGELRKLLKEGKHTLPGNKTESLVEFFSRREPLLVHADLDLIAAAAEKYPEIFKGEIDFLRLEDNQRGLLWVDGHFHCILSPGLNAWWLGSRQVRHEVVDITENGGRLLHPQLDSILRWGGSSSFFKVFTVHPEIATICEVDGGSRQMLAPGRYAFWLGSGDMRLTSLDTRENSMDIDGQDIMSADKLTLRLNATLAYTATDPEKAMTVAVDARQALYREAQLAIRGAVGSRELEPLLADKAALGEEIREAMTAHAERYGYTINSFGVRDIILPGETKALLSRVVEAKKAAEAHLSPGARKPPQ